MLISTNENYDEFDVLMLNDVMLNDVMLNDVMLNDVMLNDVMLLMLCC